MNPLHFYAAFPVLLSVAGTLLVMKGFRQKVDPDRPGYEYAHCKRCQHYASNCDCGLTSKVAGFGMVSVAAIMLITAACLGVGRSVSRVSCEKRAELTGQPYEWFDINFFSYQCVLRTPSGNATTSQVLPIEDVGVAAPIGESE